MAARGRFGTGNMRTLVLVDPLVRAAAERVAARGLILRVGVGRIVAVK